MENIGFKIENCDNENNLKYLNDLLNYIKKYPKTPIEFGVECHSKPRTKNPNSIVINKLKEAQIQKLNAHLSIEKKILNIKNEEEEKWIKFWKDEFKIYQDLNIKHFVIHVTSKERKMYEEKEQFDNIVHNIKILQSLTNIPFYMENTYEDIYYYKRLFEHLFLNNIKINFTCDVGHLKVHSKQEEKEWFDFLNFLYSNNVKLHFHIHDNDGTYDQHLTLNSVNDIKTINFIKKLLNLYKDSIFILENRSFNFEECLKDKKLLEYS